MPANILIAILAFIASAIYHPAQAQQPTKFFRLGYLSNTNPDSEFLRSEAIRLALRERGYIEGQHYAIVYRYADQNAERGRDIAAELAALKVDVILVVGGTTWVRAVKNATKTIPIVMVSLPVDPVGAKLVNSFAHPGGNLTGIYLLTRELGGKRLELFKAAVPDLTRVAVLNDPDATGTRREVKEDIPAAARALNLKIQIWDARNVADLNNVTVKLNKQRPDGLYVTTNAVFAKHHKLIVDFTLKSRLPSMYTNNRLVEAGGLMSYGADLGNSYHRVAYYVDRILRGATPADLPVEQPMKFEFAINLKTAKQIGLTIPPNVLARADRVIK